MYCVSKQIQWPDGTLMIEVSAGGIDYVNPGLVGNIHEFLDPREAVEKAIELRAEWQAQSKDEPVSIGYGATGGFTMPFSECDEQDARRWSEKKYDSLLKCDWCGEILGQKTFTDEYDDYKFCSESCWEKNHIESCLANEQDDEELVIVLDDE